MRFLPEAGSITVLKGEDYDRQSYYLAVTARPTTPSECGSLIDSSVARGVWGDYSRPGGAKRRHAAFFARAAALYTREAGRGPARPFPQGDDVVGCSKQQGKIRGRRADLPCKHAGNRRDVPHSSKLA